MATNSHLWGENFLTKWRRLVKLFLNLKSWTACSSWSWCWDAENVWPTMLLLDSMKLRNWYCREQFAFLDQYRGEMRWHISFNLGMILFLLSTLSVADYFLFLLFRMRVLERIRLFVLELHFLCGATTWWRIASFIRSHHSGFEYLQWCCEC